MHKKVLAILVVIMLVLPSTALAMGKPASVGGETQGKPEFAQGQGTENTGKGGNSSQLPTQAGKATENIPDDEFTKGNGREKAEQIVAEKKALKDQKVEEAKAIAEEKSDAAKNGATGLKRAAEVITANLSKVGSSAIAALQSVLGKFAAWLSLAGDDGDQPGGGEAGDENDTDSKEQPEDEEAGVEEGTTEEGTDSEDI